jgi:hypothetical protein
MHKIHRRVIACLAAAVVGIASLLLGSFAPVLGAPASDLSRLQSTLVSVDPPSITVPAGDTATVDIRITGVMDLDTMELYMTYDQDLIEIVDMRPSEPGIQIEIGPFLHPTATDVNFVNPEYGEIDFLQQAPGAPVNGSGVVARITARGKAPGTATLGFDAALLYDQDGIGISVRTEEGAIIVTQAGEPTATASPSPTFTPEPGQGTATAVQSPSPSPTTGPGITPSPSATPGTPSPSPLPSPTMPGESPLETPIPGVTPSPGATPSPFPQLTPPAGIPDLRVYQIWPDRVLDVVSGRVVAPEPPPGQTVLFGVSEADARAIVHARTYFHFPMSGFPPGTDILKATLYVHADSATAEGQGVFGLYRVVAPWTEQSGSANPDDWPPLLAAAISLTEASFEPPASDAQRYGRIPARAGADTSGGPASSRAPGAMRPQAQAATATAPTSPLLDGTVPVTLSEVAGTWVTWDATALLRAWYREDIPNQGLAISAGPVADAGPEEGGNILAARWLAAGDRQTRPYLVVHVEVRPVTPTPSPIYCLPAAGLPAHSTGGLAIIPVAIGAALLVLGVAARRR